MGDLVFNMICKETHMSYTKAEEQSIRENAPVTLEVATRLASQFGKSTRSVISKSVMLKVYKAKPKAFPRDRTYKRDTVLAIEKTLGCTKGELQSLENAKGTTLDILFQLLAERI